MATSTAQPANPPKETGSPDPWCTCPKACNSYVRTPARGGSCQHPRTHARPPWQPWPRRGNRDASPGVRCSVPTWPARRPGPGATAETSGDERRVTGSYEFVRQFPRSHSPAIRMPGCRQPPLGYKSLPEFPPVHQPHRPSPIMHPKLVAVQRTIRALPRTFERAKGVVKSGSNSWRIPNLGKNRRWFPSACGGKLAARLVQTGKREDQT